VWINSPSHRCVLVGHYLSSKVSRGVSEKMSSLTSLEGSDLVPMG
jgi:hypothetical protein